MMSVHARQVCRYCRETAVMGGDVCPDHYNNPLPVTNGENREMECRLCRDAGLVPDLADDGSGRHAYCDCAAGAAERERDEEELRMAEGESGHS